MVQWDRFFGEKLIDNKGKEYDTASELQGKIVLIYFSAHWCPPCRQFTPTLAKVYQTLKSKNVGPFEIVFSSSDNSEHQFHEYFDTMPWKSYPNSFASAQSKALSKKYRVAGIPKLVVLDKDGELINPEGRSAVLKDQQGDNFPWYPKKLHEILGDTLVTKENNEIEVSELKGKTVGVLFGGKWVGQKFLSFSAHLKQLQESLNSQGKEFKVIFGSLDKTARDYRESLAALSDDVLTFEFKDPRVEELAESLTVDTLPHFTVVDGDGIIINNNAYTHVLLDKTGDYFPWGPRAVEPVDLASNSDINSSICVVAFVSESSDAFKQFQLFGEQYVAAFKRGEKDEVKFYYSNESSTVGARLKGAFQVRDYPALLFMSLPKFKTITDFDALEATVTSVTNGTWEFSSL